MNKNQTRVLIRNAKPQIDGGLYPIKRVVGQKVQVKADILADGHDVIVAILKVKHENETKWKEFPMQSTETDEWNGEFLVNKQGHYCYKIEAWIDHALNWQKGTALKIKDGQNIKSELLEGASYLEKMLQLANAKDMDRLIKLSKALKKKSGYEKAKELVTKKELRILLEKYPIRLLSNESAELKVFVDSEKALFSTWYEFFPRSASKISGKHGTFKDCTALLPRIAEMGFDTVYFPPIHPIGKVNRKGKNNSTKAENSDVGSPWAIGSRIGGHKSITPELGTSKDFKALISKAKSMNIDVALDLAFQAAPDHPYVKTHPQWFKWRPDGTAQYAENPPKKYQDILPFYFESEDYENLWEEFLSITLYWIEEFKIEIFRVDNPHTKPFNFWGWLIAEVKKKYPQVIFLAEAFTRPKIMMELAKQGFTQSYTYFTWRISKDELIEYVHDLTKTESKEFFRPNFWPNTPDINPYHLQGANESTYLQRYFLAATLSSNVGIYGPVFELMISDALIGKEEYLDSEKYQLRNWDWKLDNKIIRVISKINQARKDNTALQQTNNIEFCEVDNDMLMAYYKFDDSGENQLLIVISLDAYYSKQGWVKTPLAKIGIAEGEQFRVEDLITKDSYIWTKEWNFVELHPTLPFHLFKIHF